MIGGKGSKMKRIVFVACVLMVLVGSVCSAATLSYLDLINRLTDMEAVAVLPAEGETCVQWSSYDRSSVYDAETGKYVKWDANGDGHQFIRQEGDVWVAAEMEGPGCIWRIWSAQAKEGHVRIYLDGASEPAVDLPFDGYFNRKNAPFIYPSLVHTTAAGRNCYVPIPYQKSCKIVMDKDWGAYYHFTYSTFPKDTQVPTFKRDLSPQETAALQAIDKYLTEDLGITPVPLPQERRWISAPNVAAAPRSGQMVTKLEGQGAISCIKVKIDMTKHTNDDLRNVDLCMFWDGEQEPSVRVPLGDFFGSAPGVNTYKSLPLGMTDDGIYSYWYMPFANGAVIELENRGNSLVTASFDITRVPLTRPIGELGRFHAKWHRDAFLPEEPERWIDWTMLKATGRGRFCGVMLEVWNPKGGWWGEGDEKFYVDGEKFPSTIGTGSEDYFGYAWCNPTLFQNAYHNQTISQGNKGHISVNRWHITDNVPFQKSFEGAIEKYYSNDRPTLYACTAYWYQAAGEKDEYKIVADEDRVFYVAVEVHKVAGAIEGEKATVLEKTAGRTATQDLSGGGQEWSGGSHLWWLEGQPGDKLTLALPVEKAGKYELKLQMTKAHDYAVVQMLLDGKKIGEPVDLYSSGGVALTGLVSFGVQELTAGEHKLAVEIVGANEVATKSYMFGLDYIKLELVK